MRACGGGLKPNTSTYNSLMAACSEAGQLSTVRAACGLPPVHLRVALARRKPRVEAP
jgi:hypothetical protein